MKKVFIDGSVGTTGLRIYSRLEEREDIEIIKLSEEERKRPDARSFAINSSDISFLCLPDDASRQAVSMVNNGDTVIIDTSTAYRTDPDFAYGFPELSQDFFKTVKNSKRIAVPGCHACGFISLIYPLIKNDIISDELKLFCHSITGYSGGGKKMISQYEDDNCNTLLHAPRQYGLTQQHKHLKEMVGITTLKKTPIFCPIVSNFYSGMVVTVPLFASDLNTNKTIDDIKSTYIATYGNGPIVSYRDGFDEDGFISALALSEKDTMEVGVFGNEERILLISRYDNLGKGASGAAIECMNIVLGENPTKGLQL